MLQMMSYPVQKSYITSNTRHFIKVRGIDHATGMRLTASYVRLSRRSSCGCTTVARGDCATWRSYKP
jgi:hypothetical protein